MRLGKTFLMQVKQLVTIKIYKVHFKPAMTEGHHSEYIVCTLKIMAFLVQGAWTAAHIEKGLYQRPWRSAARKRWQQWTWSSSLTWQKVVLYVNRKRTETFFIPLLQVCERLQKLQLQTCLGSNCMESKSFLAALSLSHLSLPHNQRVNYKVL